MSVLSCSSKVDEDEQVTTQTLVKWSGEIASGMAFLAENKVCVGSTFIGEKTIERFALSFQVVHGDLATRNILLTAKKVAKITDFGLARQLYSYSVYVKKQNVRNDFIYQICIHHDLTNAVFNNKSSMRCLIPFNLKQTPLPWRHMSLESIVDMNFSSSSDVWSYGVTLWEIFTLGRTPWINNNFNLKFVDQLKQGMRLDHPQFAPTNV